MNNSQNGDVPAFDQNTSVPDFGMRDSLEHNTGVKMLSSNDQILQNHKVLRLLNSDE